MARERSAAGLNSRNAVDDSALGLKPPTPSETASRKLAAPAAFLQPKSRAGCGAAGPAERTGREAPVLSGLTESEVRQLIDFFNLLDRWDREEAHER